MNSFCQSLHKYQLQWKVGDQNNYFCSNICMVLFCFESMNCFLNGPSLILSLVFEQPMVVTFDIVKEKESSFGNIKTLPVRLFSFVSDSDQINLIPFLFERRMLSAFSLPLKPHSTISGLPLAHIISINRVNAERRGCRSISHVNQRPCRLCFHDQYIFP